MHACVLSPDVLLCRTAQTLAARMRDSCLRMVALAAVSSLNNLFLRRSNEVYLLISPTSACLTYYGPRGNNTDGWREREPIKVSLIKSRRGALLGLTRAI